MSLWPILAALTVPVLALVLLPLLRRPGAVAARREHDLSVYRAQLGELERDQERGLLGPEEARAARLEVERRMLAADAGEGAERRPFPAVAGRHWGTALVLLLALPALSVVLYGRLGRPDLPALPFAERSAPDASAARVAAGEAPSLPSVESMIAKLEQRVAAAPDDLESWHRLAAAYQLVNQPAKAAEAYQHALTLHESSAELQAGFAEASIAAAGGIVTEKAGKALARALELDPGNPRARFYQGLALVQGGERQKALDLWAGLIKDTPADAPYLPVLRERVTALAQDLGQDPAKVIPKPAAPAVAAAEPADQLPGDPDALRAEVAKLETALGANAKDWQGWIRLARAQAALGQSADAEAALARGARVYAGAPFVQQQFAAAASALGIAAPGGDAGAQTGARGPTGAQMQAAKDMAPEQIRGMVGKLAARLARQPDDVEGWRMLARSYRVLGENAKAAEAARQVASRLPADATAQRDLCRRVARARARRRAALGRGDRAAAALGCARRRRSRGALLPGPRRGGAGRQRARADLLAAPPGQDARGRAAARRAPEDDRPARRARLTTGKAR